MLYEYHTELEGISDDVYKTIDNLIQQAKLDEPFDYPHTRYIITGHQGNDVVGAVVYGNFIIRDTEYPRFLHIIVSPKYQKTKKGLLLMDESESYLLTKGFTQVIAVITHDLPNRKMKRTYALKFGYKKYHEDSVGEYFYKKLGVDYVRKSKR